MTDALAKIDALLDEGIRLLQGGDSVAAESKFREVLEVAPDDSEAFTFLGASLQHQGRSEEARDVLKRAVALDEASPDAHYNLAEVSLLLNDLAEAELHYRRSTELEPSNAIAWRRLSEVRAKRQNQTGAAEAAEKAQQQEGDYLLPGWTERLLAEFTGEKRDLASLQKDAAEMPDNLEVQIRVYRAAAAAQNVPAFDAAMSQALRIAPGDRNVLADQVNYLLRLNLDERATTAAAQLMEQFPADASSYVTMACVCMRRHDLNSALKALDRLAQLKPDDPPSTTTSPPCRRRWGRRSRPNLRFAERWNFDPIRSISA
jgi:Flp pilus assembly protein TadD